MCNCQLIVFHFLLFFLYTEKLYNSTGRELRRALFSLKQIFQVIILSLTFVVLLRKDFLKLAAHRIQRITLCFVFLMSHMHVPKMARVLMRCPLPCFFLGFECSRACMHQCTHKLHTKTWTQHCFSQADLHCWESAFVAAVECSGLVILYTLGSADQASGRLQSGRVNWQLDWKESNRHWWRTRKN